MNLFTEQRSLANIQRYKLSIKESTIEISKYTAEESRINEGDEEEAALIRL